MPLSYYNVTTYLSLWHDEVMIGPNSRDVISASFVYN